MTITAAENNTAKAWIKLGLEAFEAFEFIGNTYFDKAGETGKAYYFLPDYQEHKTAKDSEGYPLALDLEWGDNPWRAERFVSELTRGRPQGEATIVGPTCGGWIVEMAFDNRRN